ncbi:protein unc-13 homolog D [Gadus morhua]|uniref:Unc-13 homolog D n=1 Tax=Gadus morhua TaxID=8049 RepID=A0A8C4ZIA4_GADMO|nr:protein unc-13 homolog D [Gadus morhua]
MASKSQSGLAVPGDGSMDAPDQRVPGSPRNRHRQISPGNTRKLGMTRKKERRDLQDDEDPEEKERKHKELELKPLYRELLYTIVHKLGKPASGETFSDGQLHSYIREAFPMSQSEHDSLMEKVRSCEPPVYCLMATVKEAKGILGKDISGFSDPYCLLTILEDEKESRARSSRAKPRKSVVKDAAADESIYRTEIKWQTLNPVWNEIFILEFEDTEGASFHLEMWDRDEQLSLAQKLEDLKTNFNSLRRMIKDAKKEKGADDFLGFIVLKLRDLRCTEDSWYELEPRTETYPDRGRCHLNLKFIHKERDATLSAGRGAYTNYCGVLQKFVQAFITKQQEGVPWKGEMSGEGQMLLELYATQNNLPLFQQDIGKWVAYSKLYQSLEVDSSVLFQQITSIEYHWHQQEPPHQQKQELRDSLHGFLRHGLDLVSKYRDIFPPTPKATPRLHTLLRILVQICKMKAFQKLNPADFELQAEVRAAVLEGTEDWFKTKKGLHQPMTKELAEIVGALAHLTNEVQEDVKNCKTVYNRVFVSTVQVDMFTVVYQRIDSLLAEELRVSFLLMEGLMEPALASSLFPVYLSLQSIHKDKAFLQKRDHIELTDFHERFRDALPYWLNKAFSTTLDRVERAVQVDQLKPLQTGSVPIKHSSSAVDLVTCVQPICRLWEQLSWPDPEEGFMLMVKLTEDVCRIVVTYCQLLKGRVRVLSEDSDHGVAVNMLCVVVNDLEHLRSVLTRLPTQLNWAGLRERTNHVIAESQFSNTLDSQLRQAQGVLEKEIRSALDTLSRQLNTDIETHVKSMTTRRRIPSKSTEDAVGPLMVFLERELTYLNENLVQENFNSMLTPLWTNSVKSLHQVASQHSQLEGLMVFAQRLLYTLECLEQCFHAEGNGLPLLALQSEEYKALKAHLTSNSLSSQQLIERFLERKVTQQNVYGAERYGAVTLLISYRRSDHRLCVEVLNAVNLLPMDSNGFSDPFVELSLEPVHVFPEVETRRTQIRYCDLNPLFDEAFEFLVSLEQCRAPGACLVVTVLDYDKMTRDDFEGEAFLALKAVPGVAGGGEEAVAPPAQEEFSFSVNTPPAQIRLPLMHPKPNDDSILKLLESRKGERDAQAFVKTRRRREKQSQEGLQQS